MDNSSLEQIFNSLLNNKNEISSLTEKHCSEVLVKRISHLPQFHQFDDFMKERIEAIDSCASKLKSVHEEDVKKRSERNRILKEILEKLTDDDEKKFVPKENTKRDMSQSVINKEPSRMIYSFFQDKSQEKSPKKEERTLDNNGKLLSILESIFEV